MFKSIQWKMVAIFVMLIVAVITVVGSFLMINIVNLYNREFSVMMGQVFTDDFIMQLEQPPEDGNDLEHVSSVVQSYIGQLGIDTYRFYCILDAKTGDILRTSDKARSEGLEITGNIITAMAGGAGSDTDFKSNYMDYAVCVKQNGVPKYIIYIKDTKEEIQSMTQSMLWILVQALALSLLIAIVLGWLLSRTITIPISNLTRRAEKLAGGHFENIPESGADDEIGMLSNTFRSMSMTLHETIEEVKGEKSKVEIILQNMTDGILAFNLDGAPMHINPEARAILDMDNDNIEFDSFFKNINANVAMGDLVYIKQTAPIERELCLQNGRYIHLSFTTIEIEDKIDGIVVVIHDTTKQQRLEISRREFVANVSHELRTPITTVKTYAETLYSSAKEDIERRFLSVIQTEADRMTRIIKDLLTLSQLDDNSSNVHMEDVIDLKVFIESVISKMEINAAKRGQTISYMPINEVSALRTNRDRLEQVLVNVLGNAIKYTPDEGRIEVFTSRVYNDAVITVTDNGIGIPEKDLPHIFDRFYRVDKARARDTGGTGLGLAIARQIVESFGGKINITSEQDKGTEVTINLPL